MIELTHVSKKYGKNTVVRDVTATFEAGKIHGLIGRNGSGKTVLLKCICGLTNPTEGKILVRGKEVNAKNGVPENIGVIIETPGFLAGYSGLHNLQYLAGLNKKIGKSEICAAMEQVGLDPGNPKHVNKYSLGMRQRLGIAQAIMEHPDILILDEPTNGLDKSGVAEIRKLLLDLRSQGKTILIASHISEDIQTLCDTVCEMEAGTLSKIYGWESSVL